MNTGSKTKSEARMNKPQTNLKNMISERLKAISESFAPLCEHAERYVHFGTRTDEDGTIAIGHNPKIAPEYFIFTIFPPAHQDWLVKPRSFKVPAAYLRFLSVVNGCFAYRMSLYGFAPTMQASPPLLSRTRLQCHDLTLANEYWHIEFRLREQLFHFGGRNYSHSENAGYFMEEGGGVRSLLKSGREVQRWDDFASFLRDELVAAEAYDQEQEKRRKP